MQLATRYNIKIELYAAEQARNSIVKDDFCTKHEMATALAKRFPQELANRLPSKRKLWLPEDRRMGIFEAVALALMPTHKAETSAS